jgi:hypothetical protein
MTAINEIPGAFALQVQLAAIEKAIASLKAGALVSGVTVSGQMLVQIVLNPPIEIENLVTALQGQADKLISELEGMGFAYTPSGDDVPAPLPPPTIRHPSPPPPLPFTPPIEPPDLPTIPLDPPLPAVE